MSFAVTLVQATIIPCLHSCSSLLMLPASVITVAGVILLVGRSEHVTLVPSCQWLPFSFRKKKSQSLYNNLHTSVSSGLSLLFLATFPFPHSALVTLTTELVLKYAGLLLPRAFAHDVLPSIPSTGSPHCCSLLLQFSAQTSPSW